VSEWLPVPAGRYSARPAHATAAHRVGIPRQAVQEVVEAAAGGSLRCTPARANASDHRVLFSQRRGP
jgi:hypothetical protein